MRIHPTFSRFSEIAETATLVPVWRELIFDTRTAVSAYARIAAEPFGFLLESVEGGERWARYTYLGSQPRRVWRLEGDRVSWWGPREGWGESRVVGDPIADLDDELRAHTPAQLPELPPFWGGAVGFFGYDTVRHIEDLGPGPSEGLCLPDAVFMMTGPIVVIDNLFGRARVIAPVDVRGADAEGLRRCYEAGVAEVEALVDRLLTGPDLPPLDLGDPVTEDPTFSSSTSRDDFLNSVDRAQEYIRAGDVFQVVLSQRLTLPLEAPPFELYRALRTINPSPYLFFLNLDGFQLVGSSPEALVRMEEGRVLLRPIAGTRPRGRSGEEDERLASDLRKDPKEVAEHLMLLDLGRNDIGRVSRFGEVRVSQKMEVERYSHVMHLVSTVEGTLRDGLSAGDVFRAVFPAGTVSGAPKVRALEIIDELEPVRRGPYAGAVGYMAYGGAAMNLAIAIRTVVTHRGLAHVQAGAGVVADSDREAEFAETVDKARALMRAIEWSGRDGR